MLGCWRRETKACGNNGKATNWSVLASHGKIPFHHPCLEPVLEPLSKRGASTSSGQSSLMKDNLCTIIHYGFVRFPSLFFTDVTGKGMLKKLEIVMGGIFVYLYSLQS